MSMLDWKTYRSQVKGGVGELGKLSPGTVQGYVGLSAAGQKTNLLGAKTRELIALAVAVTVRCDGCIAIHTEAALQQGATWEEIAEALCRHHGQCRSGAGVLGARPRCRRPG
jgi:AhpD family alkylhydroperoxidase